MSQKQQTQSNQTQAGVFNPASMQAFNTLIPQFQQAVSGYMNQPFSNPFFQTQRQMGTTQAQQQGGQQTSGLLNNMNAMGFGGQAQPFMNEMLANQTRANAGLTSQLGFLNPMQNALGMQQFAIGQAGGFRPFQTGGTETGQQTQSVSGLGSWLPQLLGGGLGALGSAMGGGLLGGKGMAGTGGNNPFFNMSRPTMPGGINMPNAPFGTGGILQPQSGMPSMMGSAGATPPFFGGMGGSPTPLFGPMQ